MHVLLVDLIGRSMTPKETHMIKVLRGSLAEIVQRIALASPLSLVLDLRQMPPQGTSEDLPHAFILRY
jgi:hypothetical protein